MTTEPIEVTLPIRTVNEGNARGSWQARARRAKGARHTTRMALELRLLLVRRQLVQGMLRHIRVTLTRTSAGLLDSDGAVSALKAVRDGVADALGVNDATPLVSWHYLQRMGAKRVYSVTVRIEPEAK